MIVEFKCPICGQMHGLYLTTKILRGAEHEDRCPTTHESFFVSLIVKTRVPESFQGDDLVIAEREAKLADSIWRLEERIDFGSKDSHK